MVMKAVLTTAFLAVSLGLAGPQSQPPAGPSDSATQRDHGRSLFSAKCGKCHNQDGLKKLPDGSTLLARLSSRKNPQELLDTRLKSMTAEDRNAVSLYVGDLLNQFRSAEKK